LKVFTRPLDAYVRTSMVGVSKTRKADSTTGAVTDRPATTEAASVTISEEARALVAGAAAPVDRAKVDSLRASIADGTYQVDSKMIAERMLDKSP